ncbi:hypothetical protein AVEN_41462-1 [Araneus ventricosus]|uniref:Uncharacterized protein n=1 Tax=Araneus ventricosus TaxID=182803 RepID=A0A4Y2F497_ARAVE|nr:hypothetical protein AVEN_41462-1 [Araneus ventricosus]
MVGITIIYALDNNPSNTELHESICEKDFAKRNPFTVLREVGYTPIGGIGFASAITIAHIGVGPLGIIYDIVLETTDLLSMRDWKL